MWALLLWNAHKHQKAKISEDEKRCYRIYITVWGETVLTKPLCLIHWEWEWAGKATVMSVTALIVSTTKNVAYCLLLNTNWLKHFLFCRLCRKWWKGSLSVVSVAFLFSPPLYSSLLLPRHFNSDFLLLSVTFKNCWSILAVHPIREERRGERVRRRGNKKRRM